MGVDAVVCARGEHASTFVPVVRALRAGARGRVILVNDGHNRGLWRARLAGAQVVAGPRAGKTAAMRAGLGYVRTDRVIFADADIRGFTTGHAWQLVRDNGGQIAGLRDGRIPLPTVSGERSLPTPVARWALEHAEGYEAETAINATIGALGLPAATFEMRGCTNPRKQPLTRTLQVAAATIKHIVGTLQYIATWAITMLFS